MDVRVWVFTSSPGGSHPTRGTSDSVSRARQDMAEKSGAGMPLSVCCFASPPLVGFGVSRVERSAKLDTARAGAVLIAERSIGSELLSCCDDPIICQASQCTNLALGSRIQSAKFQEAQPDGNVPLWHYNTRRHTMQHTNLKAIDKAAGICYNGGEVREAICMSPVVE